MIRGVVGRINQNAIESACAVMFQHKYYLALPLDNSLINNAVVIFDTQTGNWLLRTDVSVESFLAGEDELLFTSSTTPGKVWRWKENSWDTGVISEAPVKWVSPWNNLGAPNVTKGGFEVYITPESQGESTISLTIQTEKKSKTKTYTFQAPVPGKEAKQKALRFGGNGRRFRLIIESQSGDPWRLVGGILIVPEIDAD
jgi:hypothetical protein